MNPLTAASASGAAATFDLSSDVQNSINIGNKPDLGRRIGRFYLTGKITGKLPVKLFYW